MSHKIISRSVLERLLRNRGKKKIVFTNGCFDLLHVGHIRLLNKARSLGSALVVAINSDRSVRLIKGSGRPLVSQKNRAEILSSLSCVDYVTIFPETTPEKTIRLLQPDILMKGADYRMSEIIGRHEVVRVVRFPVAKNFSTTALIRKIGRAYGRQKNKKT